MATISFSISSFGFYTPLIPFIWFLKDTYLFIFSGQYLGHQIPKPNAADIIDFTVPRIFSFAFFFMIPAWQGYSIVQILIGLWISHMVYGFIACLSLYVGACC